MASLFSRAAQQLSAKFATVNRAEALRLIILDLETQGYTERELEAS